MTRAKDISKIITDADFSGTLDVTGDLTVDTNTLHVDSSNNRVGIGTSSPANALSVVDSSSTGIISLGDNVDSDYIRLVSQSVLGTAKLDTDGELFIDRAGNNLYIRKSGSNQVVVNSSGNVGIGTSSPFQFSTVQASLTLSGTSGSFATRAGALTFQSQDTTSTLCHIHARDGYMAFETGTSATAAERMRIDSSGRVMIGTTTEGDSFGDDLTIATTGTTGITIRSGTSSDGHILFSDGTSGADGYRGYLQYNHQHNRLVFATDASERMRIDSSGNVGIGTTSMTELLEVHGDTPNIKLRDTSAYSAGTGPAISFQGRDNTESITHFATVEGISRSTGNGELAFSTRLSGTVAERMRIDQSGNVGINETSPDSTLDIKGTNTTNGTLALIDENKGSRRSHIHYGSNGDWYIRSSTSSGFVTLQDGNQGTVYMGKTNGSSSVEGVRFSSGVNHHITMNGAQVILFNRGTNDGSIIGLAQADSTEGNITVSGNTISYNAFSASHWSRLTDNSKPTILKGTVIETIDEMMDWYQLTFTVPATDDTPEHSPKISIALEDGQSVGDTITYNHDGTDYQATIIQEDDNKHTKCKISDTADSTRVYGVFADWDADDDTVNDMYVTAVGTHVVRVNGSITVTAGDLLSSNGDGTAKVQNDDIIRSKTIGKVLTNIVQETYDDGSYTVPCALYCG